MTSSMVKKASLITRNATLDDVQGISNLVEKVYPDMPPLKIDSIVSLVQRYPEGQFVALFDDKIVGYCASIRISNKLALAPHTWEGITGNGYATTHSHDGDYLYGVETCVDPVYWNHHIGHRIYNERKELCIRLGLKGIIAGGRMVELAKEIKTAKTPEKYIEMVQQEKILDHTLLFQLRNGFEIIGVLKDYFPDDKHSLGYATHLIWHNPEVLDDQTVRGSKSHRRKHHYLDTDHVRVAAVQYKQRKIKS